MVRMLGGALPRLLTENSFGEIAEAAIVLELAPLKAACVSFAKSNAVIQTKATKKQLPPAVCELLTGQPPAPAGPPSKRRKAL